MVASERPARAEPPSAEAESREPAHPLRGTVARLVPRSGPKFIDIELPTSAVASTRARFVEESDPEDGPVLIPIGLSGDTIEHIVDELGLGAIRIGLPRRLSDGLVHTIGERADEEHVFAGTAGAVINGFVERLSLETGTNGHEGAASFHHTANCPDAADLNSAWTAGLPVTELWCASFAAMVDANIASASFMADGEAKSDLARLLAQFLPSNLEVKL